MSPIETTVVLVVVIGAAAVLVKSFSRDGSSRARAGEVDPVDALLAEVSGADPDTAGETVAVTDEGWAFVPDGHEVALVPHRLAGGGEDPAAGFDAGPDPHGPGGGGGRFEVGELIGARVRRGDPNHDPWRLEALGRDGDYRAWFFVTEEAAQAAFDLLNRRIVRPLRDEDGELRPPTAAEFEDARRIEEETERALDAPDEP